MAAPVKTVYAERRAARERTELTGQAPRPRRSRERRAAVGLPAALADGAAAAVGGEHPAQLRRRGATVDRAVVGRRRLNELTTAQISSAYAQLAMRGGQGGTSLSAGTVTYAHMVLHKALEDAVREASLLVNPATRASTPRRDVEGRLVRYPPRYWSRQDLSRFLEWIRDDDLGPPSQHVAARNHLATRLQAVATRCRSGS